MPVTKSDGSEIREGFLAATVIASAKTARQNNPFCLKGVWKADGLEAMDTMSTEERSERMGRVRNKDTKPEMVVRRLVHGLGYRYRLHGKGIPGHPDLVVKTRKKAIFVHGCFWHRHDGCALCRWPKSRLEFWKPKLEANRQRDIENQRLLTELGWAFLVVWECEIKDREQLTNRLVEFLEMTE